MDTIVSDAQQILVNGFTILAGNSVLIYDHMTTLPEEIAFIWRRPKALSAMLFLLNRYFALIVNICALIMNFVSISDESCSKYTLYRQLAIFSQVIMVCFIMTIRTYALYGGNKRLLTCMIIIMIALGVAVSVWSFGHFSGSAVILSGAGCYEITSADTAAHVGLAWVAELVFQLLILILTVYRICKSRGLLRLSLFTRKNMIDVIFHDGCYWDCDSSESDLHAFRAMVLISVPNILTYYSGSVVTRGSLTTLTSCISVTLISRLMLNLHKTIDTGIFSIPAQDDNSSLPVITTRLLSLQQLLGPNSSIVFKTNTAALSESGVASVTTGIRVNACNKQTWLWRSPGDDWDACWTYWASLIMTPHSSCV
ncbi:hypothetical protein DEU56DRAFT_901881 [Suillus clintonianus]|uniref:uncharacterized protein n=1 Tax=Suillus clintonianus TaxID=1904413 RepID=UPI001B886D20|nr:uncharacterized protein DEU56DRAFT_901881 [Suillus clintonianus]KAG2135136.1 hypothetical protein DEU56DRAFT_901881 [Suillus clintonianus]